MIPNKTILITGAAGFIASHIVDHFIDNDFTVIGVDNLKTGNIKNIHKKLIFINVDLNNVEEVKKILKKYKPKTIIHQASNLVDVELSIKYPSLAYQDLIMTTIIIEEAMKYGLQHFIFASSANVYGHPKRIPTKESSRLSPSSPYGLTKLSIENYIKYFSQRNKINYTIFRYFNVFGERQNINSGAAIPTFIKRIMNNQPVTVYGGKQTRDFVYVKDVSRANFLALTKNVTGVYNVGSGEYISINDVVNLISKILNKKTKIKYVDQDPSDSQFSHASITKIKRELHWKPQIMFEEGLGRTIAYYLKNFKKES